jgi:hypothetical protein
MTANPVALVVAIGALYCGGLINLTSFRATVDGAWSSLKVIASNKRNFTEIL